MRKYIRKHSSDSCKENLSAREVEVLRLINEGKTSNEIGEILCLSIHTEKTHRRNMLKKLEKKNTIGLLKKQKN